MEKKCLIIRFSSFGDIVQLMNVLPSLKEENFELHWAVKKEFAELVELSPFIHKIWSFDKATGFFGLIRFAFILRKQRFSHIYDAHNNIRSFICSLILKIRNPWSARLKFITRSKQRWKRFLLFYLGINKFPRPYQAILSYRRPLQKWGIKAREGLVQSLGFDSLTQGEKRELEKFDNKILLAPSAAWKMKRWPLDHWKQLISRWSDGEFAILGGKKDEFCRELEEIDRRRVTSLAGKLSLVQSCYLISRGKLLICADTGLIHVADLLGTKGLALIGPTAFGHPTNANIKVLDVALGCRPCSKDGRGKCRQNIYQQCLVDISPERVLREAKNIISSPM